MTTLETLGKGFTKQSVKLLIHLGNRMRTKDFPYCSQSSRMLCSVCYGSQGGRLGFLWIKDKSLVGSPHILDGTWELKSVLDHLLRHGRRNHPTLSETKVTRFNDAGARL